MFVQLADYKKKLDEAVQSADGYEEAKKKTAYELDARQQAIDALTSDNDKLNKSKKKIQSEVIKLSGNFFGCLIIFAAYCCYLFCGDLCNREKTHRKLLCDACGSSWRFGQFLGSLVKQHWCFQYLESHGKQR